MYVASVIRRRGHSSMKHRSAPKEKCPQCLSLWGPLGDTPPIRNRIFLGPCTAPNGTNTKVTSAKGQFCAHPNTWSVHGETGHMSVTGKNAFGGPADRGKRRSVHAVLMSGDRRALDLGKQQSSPWTNKPRNPEPPEGPQPFALSEANPA